MEQKWKKNAEFFKIRYTELNNGKYAVVSPNDNIILIDNLTKEIAARLVLCWNSHDDLLDACKVLLTCVTRSGDDCKDCPVDCPGNTNLAAEIGKKAITAAQS